MGSETSGVEVAVIPEMDSARVRSWRTRSSQLGGKTVIGHTVGKSIVVPSVPSLREDCELDKEEPSDDDIAEAVA
ncbi:MAG: hypothetical protein ACRDWA_08390 [Acidimicrobiia bacterium]